MDADKVKTKFWRDVKKTESCTFTKTAVADVRHARRYVTPN